MATETAGAPPLSLPHNNKKKSTVALQELQETMSRISGHQGVLAVMVLNAQGNVITQSGAPEVVGNPLLLKQLLEVARSYVKSIPAEAEEAADEEAEEEGQAKPNEEISFLRIRSKHEEILVAPKCGYVLVVVQDPSQSQL
jgi:dynein light chain roadblock-type